MIRFALLALAVCAALIPFSAAAKEERITEAQVRAYYEALNNSYKKPYEEHVALLKKAFRENFIGTMASTLSGAGITPTSSSDIMTYKRLIAEAGVDYTAMKNATIKQEINDIRIAEDGQSAKVAAKSTVKGMLFPTPEGGQMHVDTQSSCEDEMALNAEGVLQTVKASCAVEGTIITEKEL